MEAHTLRSILLLVLVCIFANCKGQNAIPEWLLKKHHGSFSNGSDSYNSEVSKYVILNDSISYCLKKKNTGTCQKEFIITFNKKVEVAEFELSRNCDHDLSRPYYRWKEFKRVSDTTFQIVEIVERVPAEFVDENGMVKEQFDYYEIKNKTRDTTTTILTIDKGGRLNQ